MDIERASLLHKFTNNCCKNIDKTGPNNLFKNLFYTPVANVIKLSTAISYAFS